MAAATQPSWHTSATRRTEGDGASDELQRASGAVFSSHSKRTSVDDEEEAHQLLRPPLACQTADDDSDSDSDGSGVAAFSTAAATKHGAAPTDTDWEATDVATGEVSIRSAWRRSLGLLLMVISALLFSIMSVVINVAGHTFPTFEITAFRFSVQTVLALTVLLVSGTPMRGLTHKYRLIGQRAVYGVLGMTCAFWALSHLPLSDSTALIFTNPVFTAVLAYLLLGESFGLTDAVCTALCLVGVVFISRPTFLGFAEPTEAEAEASSYAGAVGGDDEPLEFAGLAFTSSRGFAIGMALTGSVLAAMAYLTIRKIGKVSLGL